MLFLVTDQSSLCCFVICSGSAVHIKSLYLCRVNHSNNAIVKPQPKAATAEQREVEAAMAKVRQAQELIASEVDPCE